MMTRIKTALCGLIVVLALGALASSSASAASWKVNGALLVGSAALATTANVTEPTELQFSTTTILCTNKNNFLLNWHLVSPNTFVAKLLHLNDCKTEPTSPCSLSGTIIIIQSTLTITQTITIQVLQVIKPATKTVLATFAFTGAGCAFAEEVQALTGSILAKLPTGETEHTLQEIVMNTPSGELKVGSTSARLKGKVQFKLESGLPWSFQ